MSVNRQLPVYAASHLGREKDVIERIQIQVPLRFPCLVTYCSLTLLLVLKRRREEEEEKTSWQVICIFARFNCSNSQQHPILVVSSSPGVSMFASWIGKKREKAFQRVYVWRGKRKAGRVKMCVRFNSLNFLLPLSHTRTIVCTTMSGWMSSPRVCVWIHDRQHGIMKHQLQRKEMRDSYEGSVTSVTSVIFKIISLSLHTNAISGYFIRGNNHIWYGGQIKEIYPLLLVMS